MDSELLKKLIQESGVDLKQDAGEVARYLAGRAAHLSTLTADPNYERALRAEAKNCFSFAAERAVTEGDAKDARLTGLILGALLKVA